MTEMDAIRALRTGDASAFLESHPSGLGIAMGSNAAVRHAVDEMMTNGWVRTNRAFEDRKRKIFAANDLVAMKLLYDQPAVAIYCSDSSSIPYLLTYLTNNERC